MTEEPLRVAMERVRGGDPRRFRDRVADDLARVPTPRAATWPWPLAGLIAGVWAALMSWLMMAGLLVLGWVFAPLGGGSFADVLRASGGLWIIANGGAVNWERAHLSLMPLLATFGIVLFQRRAGGWLATAVDIAEPRGALMPVAFAVVAAGSAQAVAVASVMGGTVSVPLWRSVAGAAGIAVIGFSWGVVRSVVIPVPIALRSALRVSLRFAGSMVAVGALAAAGSAVAHRTTFSEVLAAVAGDAASKVQVLLLCLAYVPTIIGWAVALLVGPGFSVGYGTHVALTGVQLGALPPIPLFALIPEALPRLALLALAVPLVAALWATRRVRRSLRSVFGCVTATALLALLCTAAVAGGVGPGRLTEVGPHAWEVALSSGGWVLAAFAIRSGLAGARSRLRRPQPEPEPEPERAVDKLRA